MSLTLQSFMAYCKFEPPAPWLESNLVTTITDAYLINFVEQLILHLNSLNAKEGEEEDLVLYPALHYPKVSQNGL